MSVEFIKKGKNYNHLCDATKQQKDINYFIQSTTQRDITTTYIEEWANRNYASNEFFINWLKTILKTDNFLTVFKYLRFPLTSAKLVNDEIKPQLKRVFYAEDSYSNYTIRNKEVESPIELDINDFNNQMFNALFYRYNDILIHDLKGVNKPYRYLLDIDNVVSIDSDNGVIHKIAFSAELEDVKGYLYLDDKSYIFYDTDYNEVLNVSHDLRSCPADYIPNESFYSHTDVIRKSLFSYCKNDLEELVFLKILQRMADVNGTIPIITKLQTKDKVVNNDFKGISDKEPSTYNSMSSQQSNIQKEVSPSQSTLQAGTVVNVSAVRKEDGTIDMEIVKNYLNFFYLPVECLEFINKRVAETKANILFSILGSATDENTSAKNELQVSLGYVSKQDRLRDVSITLSKIRNSSDKKMLGLAYGIDSISVDVFLGTDFFLETQGELFELYKLAPNPIERKNILVKSSQNKNRFNRTKADREKLLYNLLPFASDIDFSQALANQLVGTETKILQTQFSYYISLFEARYGDILQFYNNLNATDSERIILINNLLNELIKVNIVEVVADVQQINN